MKKILSVILGAWFLLGFYNVHAQAQDDYVVHTIKKGEVITVLAKKYNITVEEILRINKFGPNPVLHVGDKIKLPITAVVKTTVDTIQAAPPAPPAVMEKEAPQVVKDTLIAKPTEVRPTVIKAVAAKPIVHIIQHGEVLAVLAKKYNVSVDAIIELNKLGRNPIMHVGDKIKLPASAVLKDTAAAAPVYVPVTEAAPPTIVADTLLPKPAKPEPVVHIVERGEVLAVLAKKFNVSVKAIVELNKLGKDPVVHVGDKIKLPPGAHVSETADPAKVQSPPVAKNETVVAPAPATKVRVADTVAIAHVDSTVHIVQPKETLYALSKKYKVTQDQIKTWNHLADNKISIGQKLVIFSAAAPGNTTANKIDPSTVPQTINNAPPIVTQSPAIKLPPEEKKQAPPVVKPQPIIPAADANVPATGYFSSQFGRDVEGRKMQTANGAAMTFKTASGWTDKKYYVLMNDVPPGSIVQVTNADGKTIYAKILWNMGDLKEREGVSYAISDAAAAVLGLTEKKFKVTVTYYE